MKNTVEGIKSRLDEAKDQISEQEDKVERNTQKELEKEGKEEGIKKKRTDRNKELKKKSLLLALKWSSEFCWSSCL